MAKTCDAPGCNRPRFSGPYCDYRSHQLLRQDEKFLKKEAKREEKKKEPKKEINKFNPKYQKEVNKYNRDTGPFKELNPICFVKNCGKPSTETHHMISRGIHINNQKYWRALCSECHARIKLDESWAKENELILTKTINRKHEYD